MLRSISGGHVRHGRGVLFYPSLVLDLTNGLSDPRITYSGGANGTRVNSAGLIVAATTPRFDYNPVTLAPLGLLVEEARTNLLNYSADLGDVGWTPINSVLTTNQAIAPDGTNSMDLLTRSSTAAAFIGQGITKAANALPYSQTMYAKKSVGNYFAMAIQGTFPASARVTFDLSNGTISSPVTLFGSFAAAAASIVAVGGGIYRCTLTATSDATTPFAAYFSFNSNNVQVDGTDSAANSAGYLWGAQLEQASFATSYIPTTSASVTRSADSGIISGSAFTAFYNQAGGSAVVQFDLNAVTGTRPIISFDDNTANERIELYASGTDLRMKVVDGGATQVDMSIGTVAANTTYKAAIAWAANDFAGCLNGGTVATDASGTLPTPDRLRIGSDQAGNFQCGHDKTLQVFALRLPNSTLQGMTA